MVNIKTFLKKLLSPEIRRQLKVYRRRIINNFKRKSSHKNSIEDMQQILNGLGIHAGDKIIVSSSFGNLNAGFSPQELIELLKKIITSEGLIVMPYYPPINSYEWAERGEVFDMIRTKSGMGILTNVFARSKDVFMSIHPTKAVCAWGKNAKEFVEGHENSTTPFYWDSPYGKLMKFEESKSLCLGLKNIPIFHMFEDVLSSSYDEYYQKDKKSLCVRNVNDEIINVQTYVHNPDIIDNTIPAGDYVRDLNPKSYKRVSWGFKYIVVVENHCLLDAVDAEFKKGHTRIKK